jgi:DNA-binding NtrC family response regulator
VPGGQTARPVDACGLQDLAARAVFIHVKSRAARKRVLVVEDDPILARIYSCALAAAGYFVDKAADGAEGYARLLATSYDVVVTDLCMPKLSGLDLLEQVRRRQPEVPVVMVTGELDEKTYESARKLGMVRFLVKPVTMHQLAGAVDTASRARSLSGAWRRANG